MPTQLPHSRYSFWHDHTRLLGLALPMILANITTPLLGLVDTAVLGHMSSPTMLAGASIGALILTQIYWVCGFLRMSTTGLSAQARGQDNARESSAKVLWQTMAVASILGAALLVLQVPVLQVGLKLTHPTQEVAHHIIAYFEVRVWGAPAAMLNLALIGYLVGQQKTKTVMVIQIVGNLLNAGLDIAFVYGFSLSVAGVALASIIAEYAMAFMAIWVALKHVRGVQLQASWFSRAARKVLMKLNTDMLLRNLALQACLAFLTIQGARYGALPAAVNAILIQFFVLIALGLDGIAYAVEALVGEAKGAKSENEVKRRTLQGLFWSFGVAVAYSGIFALAGNEIIALLTEHHSIISEAVTYLPLMIVMPLVAHWCFLFDGVFVGLTRSSAMRNTMILSALAVYFPIWFVTDSLGNISLWYALLAFLLARGVTLGWVFFQLNRRGQLCQ